ncbi:heavy metal-binding domain-containing protein [Hymenobacter sp. UYCo722]|uniref:heavy metal-binding domain-containing protein n=1 Tax=Hymenobacter sp. UYCo722 TaxID=3156335 RepID=UPI003399AEC4
MKKLLTYSLALASLTFATSCSDNKSTTETTTTTPATTAAADSTAAPAGTATQYTCPMHPEVVADQPGKCPKCGMDLIVKK